MIGNRLGRWFSAAIDRGYLQKAGATTIPGSRFDLLLVGFHVYQGKQRLRLEDNQGIMPGEPVGEFHLNNIRITRMAAEESARPMEWRLLEALNAELDCLAAACTNGLISETVSGFYGVNILAAGARRLGLTLVPVPPGWNRLWLSLWGTWLRRIYYSYRPNRQSKRPVMPPYEMWISRSKLVKRLEAGQPRPPSTG